MAKAKQAKPSTMQIKVWAGTPSTLEVDVKKTPASAKTFVRGRMMAREKWADRYNQACKIQLVKAREEFDNIEPKTLKPGDRFEWTARDEHTGVTFVFGLEMVSK